MDNKKLADELIEAVLGTGTTNVFKQVQMSRSGEAGVLAYLVLNHDGASAGELKDYLNVGASRIANALKSLEHKGLIKRKGDRDDKRRVIVTVTKKGREKVLNSEKLMYETLDDLIGKMGEEQVSELVRLMNTATETVKE